MLFPSGWSGAGGAEGNQLCAPPSASAAGARGGARRGGGRVPSRILPLRLRHVRPKQGASVGAWPRRDRRCRALTNLVAGSAGLGRRRRLRGRRLASAAGSRRRRGRQPPGMRRQREQRILVSLSSSSSPKPVNNNNNKSVKERGQEARRSGGTSPRGFRAGRRRGGGIHNQTPPQPVWLHGQTEHRAGDGRVLGSILSPGSVAGLMPAALFRARAEGKATNPRVSLTGMFPQSLPSRAMLSENKTNKIR